MTTYKNKKNTTMASLLLFIIGILFSCNTFADGKGYDHQPKPPIPNAGHTIGEAYGGGIVFYVYDGGQHGLIAAKADQNSNVEQVQWYNGIYRVTGSRGDGLGAGEMNTAIIVATQISDNQEGNFAAKVAAEYSVQDDGVTPCTTGGGFQDHPPISETCYGDWYLPSKSELDLLYQQRGVVGGFANDTYWSSTEVDYSKGHDAWAHTFSTDFQGATPKIGPEGVRAIRAF